MWTDCITSIRHVLKLNGYGGPQAKVNGKSQCFKGWETLVFILWPLMYLFLAVRMKNVMKQFMDIAGMYLMIARYL